MTQLCPERCETLIDKPCKVFRMAVGDIGKRFKEARDLMRPKPSQGEIARLLGVQQGRLGNWERGAHDPPPEIIQKATTVLKQRLSFFYGDNVENFVDTETGVYHNGEDDKHRKGLSDVAIDLIEAISDQRTIRVPASIVLANEVWSLKGAQRTQVNIFAYLANGMEPVKLQEAALNFEKGTVLIFKEDDYPQTDTYLLFRSLRDPDLHAIRWIDPHGDPKALITDDPDVPPLRLGEWTPIGYCYAEIQGSNRPAPRIVIRPDGFGPNRR